MQNEFIQYLQTCQRVSGLSISEGGKGINTCMHLGNTRFAAEEVQRQNKHLKLTDIMEGMKWLEKQGLNILMGGSDPVQPQLRCKKVHEKRKAEIARMPTEVKALVGSCFYRLHTGGRAEIFLIEDVIVDETIKNIGAKRPGKSRATLSFTQKLVLT